MNKPSVLTSDYTLEDQINIEALSCSIIVNATLVLDSVLASKPKGQRRGMVITDRTPLDGHVYSMDRCPDEDQEHFSAAQLAEPGFMLVGGSTDTTKRFEFREDDREVMRQVCDQVVLADHTTVPFMDNGLRETELSFRDRIAQDIAKYYSSVLGTDRVVGLRGAPEERKQALRELIIHLSGQLFAV
jgi:hypothetical protein